MNFLLDVLLLLIVVITIVRCTSRGFVKSVVNLVSVVVAFFAANSFTAPVSAWLKENVFSARITASVTATIRSLAARGGEVFDLSRLFADMPDEFASVLARYGANTEQLSAAYGSFSQAGADQAGELAGQIAEPVVAGLSDVCGFLLVFVAVMLACLLLGALLDLIVKLPVLRSANRLLGFLLGLICAAALALIYAGAAEHLTNYLHSVDPVAVGADVIDRTILLKYLCRPELLG